MEDEDDYYYDNVTDNDTYPYDQDRLDPSLRGSNIFLPVMYYLIFFMGFGGNLFVISVVGSKGKRSGRLVDTFVVNLALADLVFVLTLPLWAVTSSRSNRWDFGRASNLLCKLSSYIISVNRFSNIFFLTCMSIDRYLAIVRMMDSRYLRSSRCIRLTCAALWMASLVLGVPSLVYREIKPLDVGQACQDDDSTFFLVRNLVVALVTFVFPVLIIVLCYGTISLHLHRHCVAAGNPRAEARRRHSLKMVFCIIAAFVVSWLPFNTFESILIISQLAKIELTGDTQFRLNNGKQVSCCLAFFNSCVNPAIYFFLDNHFRRRAQVLYKSCTGTPKVLQSFNSSTSYTNGATSESFATNGGRSQLQMSL